MKKVTFFFVAFTTAVLISASTVEDSLPPKSPTCRYLVAYLAQSPVLKISNIIEAKYQCIWGQIKAPKRYQSFIRYEDAVLFRNNLNTFYPGWSVEPVYVTTPIECTCTQ
jgi:hypothetical protein